MSTTKKVYLVNRRLKVALFMGHFNVVPRLHQLQGEALAEWIGANGPSDDIEVFTTTTKTGRGQRPWGDAHGKQRPDWRCWLLVDAPHGIQPSNYWHNWPGNGLDMLTRAQPAAE